MPINEPGIEQLRSKADSAYTLVVEAARRARMIMDGSHPLVEETDEENKPLSIAIDEINRGLLSYHRKLEDEQ